MNLQAFDLNLLKTFDSLMETLSVSRTAQHLSLTQPAVSNALARLRRLMDDPLLVRTKNGMEPTPRALSLKGPVKDGLRRLEEALLPASSFDPARSDRRFTLATPDFIGIGLLSVLLPRWRKSAPEVTVQVRHLGPETPERELEQGVVDLAIGRFLDVPSRFKRLPLRQERLVCLLSRHHPLRKSSLNLGDFLQLQHLWVSNSGRRGMVDRWLHHHKMERRIAVTMSTYTSGAMLVAESEYAMVVAASYGDYFAERLPVQVLPLEFDPGGFSIDMLWHPFTDGDVAQRWLRSEVETAFHES